MDLLGGAGGGGGSNFHNKAKNYNERLNEIHVIVMICHTLSSLIFSLLLIVRSLSGKNWQDRNKADKVSISFPATPKDN